MILAKLAVLVCLKVATAMNGLSQQLFCGNYLLAETLFDSILASV